MVILIGIFLIIIVSIIGYNFNNIKHWYKLHKIKQSKEFLDSVNNANQLKQSLKEIFKFVQISKTNVHGTVFKRNEQTFSREIASNLFHIHASIEKIRFPYHLFDLYKAERDDAKKKKIEIDILEYLFQRPISEIDLGIDPSKFVNCISFDSDWDPQFNKSFVAHRELTGEDKDIFLKMVGEETLKDIMRSH